MGPIVALRRVAYDEDTGLTRIRQESLFEPSGEALSGSSRLRFRGRAHVSALVRDAGPMVDA